MRLIYVYSNCSEEKYCKLFKNAQVMILQQAQKYHQLLITGLHDKGAELTCLSGLPINRDLTKQVFIGGETETVDGVQYRYLFSINLPGARQLCLLVNSFVCTLFAKQPDVVICDILNISVAMGARAAAKLRNIPAIGIVTDVPGCLCQTAQVRGLRLTERVSKRLMRWFDAYVLLTAQMNALVNPYKRPHVVLEGHADAGMAVLKNELADKSDPRVVLYAGSLKRQYGIDRLVGAFIKADLQQTALHIYGDGDYAEELRGVCALHPNVVYQGIKLNSEIVKAECRATLLVNPRPTDRIYTQYSFPSKNMEYMASGTPLLTTCLPGMPPEYAPYVYLLKDESEAGIRDMLVKILSLPKEELHAFGRTAKMFVLDEKSNVRQAQKILDMIGNL